MRHQAVSLREANQNFSRLIAAVERGEMFVITRRGREIAHLTPSNLLDKASTDSRAGTPIPLTDAALAERMRRLEILVDKLLAALSAPERN